MEPDTGRGGTSRSPAARRGVIALRVLALAAGVVILLGVLVPRIQTARRLTSSHSGASGGASAQMAPDFTVHTWAWWDQQTPPVDSAAQAAETVHLAALRGAPVVINFWASWCAACRAEAPAFEAAWLRYRAQGVVFVGIDVEDTEQDSEAFLRQFGITYFTGSDVTETIVVAYAASGLPMTVFIDRKGYVANKYIGELDATTLDTSIQALLR